MPEYDDLPGLGHNIITAISCGAAAALTDFPQERDLSIEAYGAPAEEAEAARSSCSSAERFRGWTSR
jgi:metal-dependent amidase/aminoacylase/carboxypeptidase family protein